MASAGDIGVCLPHSKDVKVDISSLTTEQQPQSQPIAHYKTDFAERTGTIIGVNDRLIVYAIKGGMIRVIEQRAGLKLLLRGHPGPVCDLSFFSRTSDVLGSVSEDGTVLIWRVFDRALSSPDPETGSMKEIAFERLLQISYPGVTRLVWHPLDPNKFLLVHGNSMTLVDTLHLPTTLHPTDGHAYCPPPKDVSSSSSSSSPDSPVHLGRPLTGHALPVLDVSFDPSGLFAVSGGEDGKAKVWSLDGDGKSSSSSSSSFGKAVPCVRTFEPHRDGGAVTKVLRAGGEEEGGGDLIFGGRRNATLALWTSPLHGEPRRKQGLEFVDSKGKAGPVCALAIDETGEFVCVADTQADYLYAVRLGGGGESEFRFDYVTPFRLNGKPVLSWVGLNMGLEQAHHDSDKVGEERGFEINLFCVQTTAIQIMKLCPGVCFQQNWLDKRPPSEDSRVLDVLFAAAPPTAAATTTTTPTYTKVSVSSLFAASPPAVPHREESSEPVVPIPSPIDPFENWLGSIVGPTPPSASKPAAKLPATPTSPAPAPAPAPKPASKPVSAATSSPSLPLPPAPSASTEATPTPTNPDVSLLTPDLFARIGAPKPTFESQKVAAATAAATTAAAATTTTDTGGKLNAKSEEWPPAAPRPGVGVGGGVPQPQTRLAVPAPAPTTSDSSPAPSSAAKAAKPPSSLRPADRGVDDDEDEAEDSRAKGPKLSRQEDSGGSVDQVTNALKSVLSLGNNNFNLSKASEQKLTKQLEKAVELSFTTAVVPTLNKSLQSITEKSINGISEPLQALVAKQLTAEVQKLGKAVTRAIKEDGDKARKESVEAIVSAVKEPLIEAFTQAMQDVLVPAFEAATKEMFTQVNSSLNANLKAVVAKIPPPAVGGGAASEATSALLREQNDALKKQLQAMTAAIQTLSTQLEKVQVACDALAKNQSSGKVGYGGGGAQSVQSSIEELALAELEALKKSILGYIGNDKYEEAFTLALGAKSLDCTIFACKNTDTAAVFPSDGGCRVSQTILLCLMQQLGSSIANGVTDYQMEREWLQEIAGALDPNNSAIQPHIQNVLVQLVSHVTTAIESIKDGPLLAEKKKLNLMLKTIKGIGA